MKQINTFSKLYRRNTLGNRPDRVDVIPYFLPSDNKQKTIKILLIIAVSALLYTQKAHGNNNKENGPKLYKRMQASYAIGAQLYNDNFLYNPGYSINASVGKRINSDISVGLGMGYMSLTNETFLPVYAEVIGRKKNKKNSPVISFQTGYSAGWNTSLSAGNNYSMNGGAYINAGLGRQIRVNDNYALLFLWSYCHQFAKLEYEIFGGTQYSEVVNYDMIQISIGILFN